MKHILLSLFCLFTIIQTIAQFFTLSPEFGKFSKEEIEFKKCDFEPEATAVVLYDRAWSFHYGYWDYTTRRTRIKILSKTGITAGDITLPFFLNQVLQELIRFMQ